MMMDNDDDDDNDAFYCQQDAHQACSVVLDVLSPVHTAYGAVRRRRTLQMLPVHYMLLVVVVTGHNCVAVGRRRCVYERCRRNQSARLQRRVPYDAVRQRRATYGRT